MTLAEHFKKLIDDGEENALEQAVEAGDHHSVNRETRGSPQVRSLAMVRSMKSGTFSTRIDYDDRSYLNIERVDGKIESTECGMTEKEVESLTCFRPTAS
jgi:hypothetical protein